MFCLYGWAASLLNLCPNLIYNIVGIQQQGQQFDQSIQVVYGTVTNGIEWVFIRLDTEQKLSRSAIVNLLIDRSQM
jgi:hypothetical protein